MIYLFEQIGGAASPDSNVLRIQFPDNPKNTGNFAN